MADLDYRAKRDAEAAAAKRARVLGAALFAAAVVVVALLVAWLQVMGGGRGGAGMDGAVPNDRATITMVDTAGREVQVPEEPQSIAVMDSFSGELAVMVGAGPRLCGVPSGVKSDAILQQIYPGLTTEPTSTSGSTVNIETLLARNCDLAIVRQPATASELSKLERANIPYVLVGYSTIEEQIRAIRVVGRACGGESLQKAEQLAAFYEQVLATVDEHAARIPEDERVRVFHSINGALLTDAAGSLGADWIARTGCVDVSAGTPANNKTDFDGTIEEVYSWNPDVVICNVAGTAGEIRSDVKWSSVAAVAEGRVYSIPIGATRWGQRGSVETYFAMLWLGCTVYPEVYSDVDLRQMVADNYRDVLGVQVDDELWGKIVSGEGIRSAGNGQGSGQGQGNGQGGGQGGNR